MFEVSIPVFVVTEWTAQLLLLLLQTVDAND